METETADLADLMTAETTVEAKISTNALFLFPREAGRTRTYVSPTCPDGHLLHKSGGLNGGF